MRIIKLGLLSVFFLFLVITIISLFIPSHVRISKAINVMAPVDSVLQPVRDFERWKQWYPLLKEVEQSDIQISQTAEGKSMQIKNTKVVLQKSTGRAVEATFTAGEGREIQNGWQAISYPQTDSVTVQWYMDFKLRWYPWEKFSSMLYEKMYGSTMEKGLTNLKEVVEANRSSIK